jgi:prepilin-type N-terminal cleavage/methylation domain-containing protein
LGFNCTRDDERGQTSNRDEQNNAQTKGFSLIELLIVVAIILIIAAIAIPNLLRARIAANESSAAASIRTIATSSLIKLPIPRPAMHHRLPPSAARLRHALRLQPLVALLTGRLARGPRADTPLPQLVQARRLPSS